MTIKLLAAFYHAFSTVIWIGPSTVSGLDFLQGGSIDNRNKTKYHIFLKFLTFLINNFI